MKTSRRYRDHTLSLETTFECAKGAVRLTLCSDLGLLPEEYDTQSKRMVGNFPQAFSHIALVNAAFDLESEFRVRDRSEREGQRSRTRSG